MFTIPKKSGQQMAKKGRRKAMTQDKIDVWNQSIVSTSKVKRPFVCDQPGAPVEEVHQMIVLTATNTFGKQEYLTPLAPAKFWHINFPAQTNKMDQAKQYCIIYNAKLTPKEMEHICRVTYKYICFMSTLPYYTDYQLEETGMILRNLDPPLYNITKGIPKIGQKWPEIQQYLLTGNIYLMCEAPSPATWSREVSFAPESDEEKDDISEEGQEEEEDEEIFNSKETSHGTSKTHIVMKGKNSEHTGKCR